MIAYGQNLHVHMFRAYGFWTHLINRDRLKWQQLQLACTHKPVGRAADHCEGTTTVEGCICQHPSPLTSYNRPLTMGTKVTQSHKVSNQSHFSLIRNRNFTTRFTHFQTGNWGWWRRGNKTMTFSLPLHNLWVQCEKSNIFSNVKIQVTTH